MMVAAVPAIAMSQKTPVMDKATDDLKAYLWKKGMSVAPTDMYLAATYALKAEVCGKPLNDEMLKFHLRTAAIEAPASVIETWYLVMKQKMKVALTANPEEAVVFCK